VEEKKRTRKKSLGMNEEYKTRDQLLSVCLTFLVEEARNDYWVCIHSSASFIRFKAFILAFEEETLLPLHHSLCSRLSCSKKFLRRTTTQSMIPLPSQVSILLL